VIEANELSQSRNSNANGITPKISALSSFDTNTINSSRKYSKPADQAPINLLEQNDGLVKGNVEAINTNKKKTRYVRLKYMSTKSMVQFPSNLKALSPLPDIVSAHRSYKKNSAVEAYSAVTHQGLIRNYNEDRVSVILNLEKPYNKTVGYWPTITFFGLYDGHGGAECAEYLRDHLHYFVRYK
jgi:hypothetical protein